MIHTKHNKQSNKFMLHQKNDIKPDEIHEPTQKPPTLLTETDKREALSTPAKKISLSEKYTDVHIGPPKPTKFKAELVNPPNTNIVDINPDNPIVPVTLKLLNKLGIIKNLENKINKNVDIHIKKIMTYVKKTHLITLNDVIKICKVKKAEANKYLNYLTKKKFLTKQGNGNTCFYKPYIK